MSNEKKKILGNSEQSIKNEIIKKTLNNINIDKLDLSTFDLSNPHYGKLVGLKIKRLEQILQKIMEELMEQDSVMGVYKELFDIIMNEIDLEINYDNMSVWKVNEVDSKGNKICVLTADEMIQKIVKTREKAAELYEKEKSKIQVPKKNVITKS